jgi:hypothetical protein
MYLLSGIFGIRWVEKAEIAVENRVFPPECLKKRDFPRAGLLTAQAVFAILMLHLYTIYFLSINMNRVIESSAE